MGGKTSLLAGLVTRIVFVLGFAYVSLWWSYQHFYGVFAISPDDVGLAPGGGGLGDVFGSVLRLGLWLSVALLALGLLPVFCVGAALYALEHPRFPVGSTVPGRAAEGHDDDPNAGGLLLTLAKRSAAALLALGVLVGIFAANAKLMGAAYAGVVVAIVVLVTYGCRHFACSDPVVIPQASRWTKKKTPSFLVHWWSARQRWLLRISDLFLVLAVIGVLFVDLPGDAHDVATTLLDNAGTRNECKVPSVGAPVGRFRLDLLNVRGIPAKFAVATLPHGLPSRRPFDGIYLGSANGWIVIYQKISDSKGRVLRIPTSSGASIIVDAALPNCEGVH